MAYGYGEEVWRDAVRVMQTGSLTAIDIHSHRFHFAVIMLFLPDVHESMTYGMALYADGGASLVPQIF